MNDNQSLSEFLASLSSSDFELLSGTGFPLTVDELVDLDNDRFDELLNKAKNCLDEKQQSRLIEIANELKYHLLFEKVRREAESHRWYGRDHCAGNGNDKNKGKSKPASNNSKAKKVKQKRSKMETDEIRDWSSEGLLREYENLRKVVQQNIPNLWLGLEFALSVKSILRIKDCTLPFTGIILGPASCSKTVIIECFRGYNHTFYTDNFSPKSFVSHITGKTEEQLRKDDLLPKLKNKFFMTPELSPVFSARDDDLLQLLGIITRIVDGHGYESDTGACVAWVVKGRGIGR